jgi:hypothetical protein
MKRVQQAKFRTRLALSLLLAAFAAAGCSVEYLGAGMVGRFGKYDYSPSVIQTGNVKQFWWCGFARNPTNSSQETDAILYESIDSVTGTSKGPLTVLAETAGSWDSVYACNPKVIGGSFNNPLGDGASFQYAMYYVGTADPTSYGSNANIGVAFSNDGIHWRKYPHPVIRASSNIGYGVGQPALYNVDHRSGIRMFYEDSNPNVHHVAAISTDGVHFTVQGTLTTQGLDPDCPDPSWGDMAYDPTTAYWYAVFNRQLRDPATTGGVTERGQLGVELYRIPDSSLLTGATPWQQLTTIDTVRTGFESNFIAAFVRDMYGNLNIGAYPTIQMYLSVSNPQPAWNATPAEVGNSALINQWDIGPVQWTPNNPLLPLYQYFNGSEYLATTGWVTEVGNFQQMLMLGHLYESPQNGANVALYGCKSGSTNYFISLDIACDGKLILGTEGYGYPRPIAGLKLVPLYRCSNGQDYFVSQDPKCGGKTTDELLGYITP